MTDRYDIDIAGPIDEVKTAGIGQNGRAGLNTRIPSERRFFRLSASRKRPRHV